VSATRFCSSDFLAVIFLQPVHSGRSAKKRGLRSSKPNKKQAPLRHGRACFATLGRQWPKNNHNRMITGIGTPNNHNKIPRPILASSDTSIEEKTCGRIDGSYAQPETARAKQRFDF
jgi:hypothetical protein